MSYKRPNVNKRRVKKTATRIMNAKTLAEFKKEHPEHKNMGLGDFNAILAQFNRNIVDEVTHSRNGISLPELLGKMLVMSFPKAKKKAIDFGASNRTGVLTYHRNWDTDDRVGKIVYSSGKRSIRYSYLWGFTPTSIFRKNMSKVYRKSWAKYIYIDRGGISVSSIIN